MPIKNEDDQNKVALLDESSNKHLITVPLKKPIIIDEKPLNTINLDFTNMSGVDVLNVDAELRAEGHNVGFDNLFNQAVLLKLAARAAKMIPNDLQKLHAGDYLEVVFQTRNFFLRW